MTNCEVCGIPIPKGKCCSTKCLREYLLETKAEKVRERRQEKWKKLSCVQSREMKNSGSL